MKKCARKTLQLIQGWAKNGNVNVVHYLYILEAELAVLHGKNKNAKKSFNDAIATSSRDGFIQDRALAHELASAYFEAQGDAAYFKRCKVIMNGEDIDANYFLYLLVIVNDYSFTHVHTSSAWLN
jgi:hypothetical protein